MKNILIKIIKVTKNSTYIVFPMETAKKVEQGNTGSYLRYSYCNSGFYNDGFEKNSSDEKFNMWSEPVLHHDFLIKNIQN